jgi:hypothetical protein
MDEKQQQPDASGSKQAVEIIEDSPNLKAPDFDPANDEKKDRAAALLQNSQQQIVVSDEDNRRILRKIDLSILPIMLGVYFLQQYVGSIPHSRLLENDK